MSRAVPERSSSQGPLEGRFGRYQILRPLAIGGMAELYLARVRGQHGFQRLVVLKRVKPELASDGDFLRMFREEARLAASLQHPNIAQVFDLVESGGEHLLAMEYVDGHDAAAILLAARDGGDQGLPIELVIALGVGLAAALHHAHERREPDGRPLEIIHRDVSPSNVLVGFDGTIKLVDFGVAKARGSIGTTRVGAIKGKPRYMSPEQINATGIDRRSDLFSLGIVLYELLAGTRPFAAESEHAELYRLLHEPPVPLHARRADVPAELEGLVHRLLAKDPAARPATAEAVQIELEEIVRQRRLASSPIGLARYLRQRFGEPRSVTLDEVDDDDEQPVADEPYTASLSLAPDDDPESITRPTALETPASRRAGELTGSASLLTLDATMVDDDDLTDATDLTIEPPEPSAAVPARFVPAPRRHRLGLWLGGTAVILAGSALAVVLARGAAPASPVAPAAEARPSSARAAVSSPRVLEHAPAAVAAPAAVVASDASAATTTEPVSARPARGGGRPHPHGAAHAAAHRHEARRSHGAHDPGLGHPLSDAVPEPATAHPAPAPEVPSAAVPAPAWNSDAPLLRSQSHGAEPPP